MKKGHVFTLLMLTVLLFGFGCSRSPDTKSNSSEIDRNQILEEARANGLIMDEAEIQRMTDVTNTQKIDGTNPSNISTYMKMDTTGWKSAALADVTGGGSFGLAFASRENEKSTVIAKMGNLPTLENGQFFEGWLVRRGEEMKVVNIGKAVVVDDQQAIVFVTQIDLSDYDFFVLTQEQTHILEGSFR